MEFNTHELAWAAGFFDGEGHSCCRDSNAMQLMIGQKNRELVDRFHRAIGYVGTISQREKVKRKNGGYAPEMHVLQVSNFRDIQFIFCQLWKYLGPFKREQYKNAVVLHISRKRKTLAGVIGSKETDKRKIRYRFGSKALIRKMRTYEIEKLNASNSIVITNKFFSKRNVANIIN